MGATREEFVNFLSASLTDRITEQVRNQLPSILPEEVSNFTPRVIEKMIKKSLNQVNLAKVSSEPQSTYAGAATLTEFELKKILIDKMNKNKDKDEDPSAGSNKGIKKRKTSKDTEPTTGLKTKDLTFGSSKGTKSQPKSSKKNVQSEVPEFEVVDTDMPQDQGGNLGNDDDEPIKESASKHDWFTKPTRPQEPTDLDWNVGKTPKKGPTQSWLMTFAALSSTDKSLKSFDELKITPIDFSAYIMNGLKISHLTQENLLGPAFRLLKGTHFNYAELGYDFKECYKALLEKLDWENLEGGNYPFDLTKPLPLVKAENRQKGPADYFFNNDLKYLYAKWGISHWRAQRDDVADFAIALKMFTRSLVNQKRVEDLQLGAESHQKKINVTRPDTVRPDLQKTHPYTPYQDAKGFIYVNSLERNRLMHSDELYKFSDGTLTRLLTSLEDITKNIYMKYLPKRR
uniref:Uncharacterized protein n=1 Tax=Tanacetum cinerariifolium TaxID=118510 RepID=A0A699HAI8_TANCI|nr:hypothetical protein [Tanacetum cinerariifolium]